MCRIHSPPLFLLNSYQLFTSLAFGLWPLFSATNAMSQHANPDKEVTVPVCVMDIWVILDMPLLTFVSYH